MFNFEKPKYTEIEAYIHYKTDGIEEDREAIEDRLYPNGVRSTIDRDHVNDLYQTKTRHINEADHEILKTLHKKARMKECKLGVCKALNGKIQEQYDYNNYLDKLVYKDKDIDIKKPTPVHDYHITISFDDKKLFDKNGNIKYKDLVKIMKSIQGYKWIKVNSTFEEFKYQLEQRANPGEPISGLHVHILVKNTTHVFTAVLDALTKPNSLLMSPKNQYIDNPSKVKVQQLTYNKIDQYISDVNLKKEPEKRARQVNDRILQIEYNKYVVDPMIKSIVVPQQ